ncbi:MAG: hypothetical protein EGR33_04505 [Prevotella sp.]|nr:hypothetical protein [Prevotella sp.]
MPRKIPQIHERLLPEMLFAVFQTSVFPPLRPPISDIVKANGSTQNPAHCAICKGQNHFACDISANRPKNRTYGGNQPKINYYFCNGLVMVKPSKAPAISWLQTGKT